MSKARRRHVKITGLSADCLTHLLSNRRSAFHCALGCVKKLYNFPMWSNHFQRSTVHYYALYFGSSEFIRLLSLWSPSYFILLQVNFPQLSHASFKVIQLYFVIHNKIFRIISINEMMKWFQKIVCYTYINEYIENFMLKCSFLEI